MATVTLVTNVTHVTRYSDTCHRENIDHQHCFDLEYVSKEKALITKRGKRSATCTTMYRLVTRFAQPICEVCARFLEQLAKCQVKQDSLRFPRSFDRLVNQINGHLYRPDRSSRITLSAPPLVHADDRFEQTMFSGQ